MSGSRSRFQLSEVGGSSANLLGKGTYASVYKATDSTGVLGQVALKKIEFDFNVEGCPLLLLREVGLMKKYNHPNIVSILDVEYNPSNGYANIVFELLNCDLRQFLNNHGPFRDEALVLASAQVANGLAFMHSQGIIHRDLKPQNILVRHDRTIGGEMQTVPVIKIGDLGLARPFSPELGSNFTKEVMTLWYRCPELLLGATVYGPLGDCWSLGCLIGEMGSAQAMFIGESEIAVLFKIFQTLGTPADAGTVSWPGVEKLPYYSKKFPKWNLTHAEVKSKLFELIAYPKCHSGKIHPNPDRHHYPATTPRDQIRTATNSCRGRNRYQDGHDLDPLLTTRSLTHDTTEIYSLVSQIMCDIFNFSPNKRISATQVVQRLLMASTPATHFSYLQFQSKE